MIKNMFINNFSIDLIEDSCKLYKRSHGNKKQFKGITKNIAIASHLKIQHYTSQRFHCAKVRRMVHCAGHVVTQRKVNLNKVNCIIV